MKHNVKIMLKQNKLKAFTLVELLVVISIIGIISALIVVNFNQSRIKARDNKRISDANTLASALGQYYTSNLRTYPLPGVAGDGTSYLSVAINSSSTWLINALTPYISPVPTDASAAYSYYYVYRNDGKRAAVVALALESGRAKCNIVAGSSSLPPILSDPTTGFLKTKPTACYYVSL